MRKRHVEFFTGIYVTETVAAAEEYRAGKQKEVAAAAESFLVSVEKMKETTACLLIQKLQAYTSERRRERRENRAKKLTRSDGDGERKI